jgi:hypothetical protein
MKGAKLYVAILTPLALILGIVMAVFAWNESWSQNHNTVYDPFLYLTLFAISTTFITASYGHPDKFKEVTKIKKWSIRLEHLLRLVCLLFGGVIVFGVNSPVWWIETLHLAFTGAAIITGYIMVITYPTTNKGHIWAFIGTVFGGIGFLGAFIMGWYSVAFGEVLATIPFVVWMFYTWILKKD